MAFQLEEAVRDQCRQSVNHFINGLRSSVESDWNAAGRELQQFLCHDLQAMCPDAVTYFLEELCARLFDLLRSPEHDKKGLLLAIIVLVSVDVGNLPARCSRFGNLLRNLPLGDVQTMEMTALAIGRIARSSASNKAEYVEQEVARSFDWLTSDRHEHKKQFAFRILRELAIATPNYFASHLPRFFDIVQNPLLVEPNVRLQESAVFALRGCFYVITSRELQEKRDPPPWFERCYHYVVSHLQNQSSASATAAVNTASSTLSGYTAKDAKLSNKELDRIYGALLVINELLRFADARHEHLRRQVLDQVNASTITGTSAISQTSFILSHETSQATKCSTRETAGSNLSRSLSRSFNRGTQMASGLLLSRRSSFISKSYNRYLSANASSNNALISNTVLANLNLFVTNNSSFSLQSGRVPICESQSCRQLIQQHFEQICRLLVSNRWHKQTQIQQIFLQIWPRLASFDVETFAKIAMSDAFSDILSSFRKEKDRTQSFVSLGLCSISLGSKMKPYFKNIMDILRSSLPAKESGSIASTPPIMLKSSASAISLQSKKNRTSSISVSNDASVFVCISLMARALGPSIESELQELLDPMIMTGLSVPLTNTLCELSLRTPSLKPRIQDGLFKMLNSVLINKRQSLSGSPTASPTSPNTKAGFASSTSTSTSQILVESDSKDNPQTVILALKILCQFDFQSKSLLQFLRFCSDVHLSSDNVRVRLQTVSTCCKLLTPLLQRLNYGTSNSQPISNESPNCTTSTVVSDQMASLDTLNRIVGDVLQKLFIVGITDLKPEVRLAVLKALDEQFDAYLANPQLLSLLLLFLKDEIFEVRETALSTVARLSSINPSYIMPTLRELMLQLLLDLKHSGADRSRELSARMLGRLIESAPRLTRTYSSTLMEVLVDRLSELHKSAHIHAVIAVLHAIGSLAAVGALEMRFHFNRLFTAVFDVLQDARFASRREVSLLTLARLIDCTGYRIEPYSRYSNLLNVLSTHLRTEPLQSIRRQLIKLLGLIGAVDPYKHKVNLGRADDGSDQSLTVDESIPSLLDRNCTEHLIDAIPNLSQFYPAVAIASLLRIIRDPSLSVHHTMAVQAVTFIFENLPSRCMSFICHVLPAYISVIKSSEASFREFLFQQLGCMIDLIKAEHIRPHLDDIFSLMRQHWSVDGPHQLTLIYLVERIANTLNEEFKIHLPRLLPYMLNIFAADRSPEKATTIKLLAVMQQFGFSLDGYLHILLPPLISLFDQPTNPIKVRERALNTIETLTESIDLSDSISYLMHPLLRTINRTPELRESAVNLLASLANQLGKRYRIFIPMVHKVLSQHSIVNQRYDLTIARLLRGNPLEMHSIDYDSSKLTKINPISSYMIKTPAKSQNYNLESSRKCQMNVSELEKVWVLNETLTTEEWAAWLKQMHVVLLRESPSIALRACYPLAQAYGQLPIDLFNAAFLACWTELNQTQRSNISASLQQALQANSNHPELISTLLNLAEFMEHTDTPLPISNHLLAQQALRCRAYAKALHFAENQFRSDSSLSVLETLITINGELRQPEATAGILKHATLHSDLYPCIEERWYEQLDDWASALAAYQARLKGGTKSIVAKSDDGTTMRPNFEHILGSMRCLESLGEWEQLDALVDHNWINANVEQQQQIARSASAAAWSLGRWDQLEEFTNRLTDTSGEQSFYEAVLAVHRGHLDRAQRLVDKARDKIDAQLTAMLAESQERAYAAMLQVQQLAELEEVMQFKLVPERRPVIIQKWNDRLSSIQPLVDDWHRILRVHSLVIDPIHDQRNWLKFASICQRAGRFRWSQRTLATLLRVPLDELEHSEFKPSLSGDGKTAYAYIKHLWRSGQQNGAFEQLQHFHRLLQQRLNGHQGFVLRDYPIDEVDAVIGEHIPINVYSAFSINEHDANFNTPVLHRLLGKCLLRLANWQEHLHGIHEHSINSVLAYSESAVQCSPHSYKAWHAYAMSNFKTLLFYKRRQAQSAGQPGGAGAVGVDALRNPAPVEPDSGGGSSAGSSNDESGCSCCTPVLTNNAVGAEYATNAVRGFFRCIGLSHGNSLQDTLRLLTLWFDDCHLPEVYETITEQLKTVPVETWLQVIPQLIARIDTPRPLVARLIRQTLVEIGRHHPQALVYPLSVAEKSAVAERRQAAKQLLGAMQQHSHRLVQQALLVSQELIRVSILWHELWQEALEEASRAFFTGRNEQTMLDILEPLHRTLSVGPATLKELSFYNTYAADLSQAQRLCDAYRRNRDQMHLLQAWEFYYQIFKRIISQLPALQSLQLQYVSPKLLACRDLELAVPGSYEPNRPIVRISYICPELQVITSKQRPRKLCIAGSDGNEYRFLLKGHEDLRQDERVMQLFGLVNTLLANDMDTSRRNLTIQRYAVIPLSHNSGLIGWVPHCDTMHTLIKDYREKRKTLLNIEHRIMMRMTKDYEKLTLMQKVELFEHALQSTSGDDIQCLLWSKSPSSEVWFERRTNYIRSLAVMSMVGYVLGLGDRHPSNLMIDRLSGKVLHIDFGDCFEVAMSREKYPEKIPFRLTRMLIKAMEVTGIEGTYRSTCEKVMRLLRNHKDSLMAMLEAFVYDPLLNWGLTKASRGPGSNDRRDSRSSMTAMNSHHVNHHAIGSLPHMDQELNDDQINNSHAVATAAAIAAAAVAAVVNASGNDHRQYASESVNKKALAVVNRIADKLTGHDFDAETSLDVREQVDLLIQQATSNENLCQLYVGWCSFW